MPADLRKLVDELPFMPSRSDIIRYWLLYSQGGVYLDCDNVAIRNFNPLLKHNFFTAPCMPEPHTVPHVACGLMGSIQYGTMAFCILTRVREIARDPAKRDRKHFGPDLMTPLFEDARDLRSACFTMLPMHYFYLLRTRQEAADFVLGGPLDQDGILYRHESEYVDGQLPFSIHLWGVNDSSTRQIGDVYSPGYCALPLCRALAPKMSGVAPVPVRPNLGMSSGG